MSIDTGTLTRTGGAAAREPDGWLALHIFYTAASRPLITQCIRPLIAELRERDLIAGHFFINYWLEGPHVRLRLRPASPAATPEVRERAEAAIDAFLRIRPALYEVTSDHLLDYYDKLFEMEYPQGDRGPYADDNGRMRLRDNNTYSYEPYEPEYDKYGGPAGVALAEWHFEHSSDLVAEVDRTMNVHLRTVRLGVSAQLMMVMATTFLGDDAAVAEFMNGYKAFWHRSFAGSGFVEDAAYARNYAVTADRVGRRFAQIRQALRDGTTESFPPFLRAWADHCRELGERVRELSAAGELIFRSASRGGARHPLTDADEALRILLNPYIHMTNNRLGTTIGDESYLAYVAARSLGEHRGGEAG
ncbi:lantibiotic dehydratase C-terminal domain-containing protein [Streptomyces sp. NPDC101150]|uniref:lantibiotic dehydratase C-terminal domain-containing protein n=1 Tax=Streptomyces sp. NPDC101150 TaxID=3366114 RepID=UPI00380C342D